MQKDYGSSADRMRYNCSPAVDATSECTPGPPQFQHFSARAVCEANTYSVRQRPGNEARKTGGWQSSGMHMNNDAFFFLPATLVKI